jgi:hypothetical protein
MHVVGFAADQRKHGEASILERRQRNQRFAFIARVDRLDAPLAETAAVAPCEATPDRRGAVPTIRQREQSPAQRGSEIRRYGSHATMLLVEGTPHGHVRSSSAAQ